MLKSPLNSPCIIVTFIVFVNHSNMGSSYTQTALKFNSLPFKTGTIPKGKYSANHHFSGANCEFSGVYHSKKWSFPCNQPWLLQLVLRHHVVPHLAVAWFWLRLI